MPSPSASDSQVDVLIIGAGPAGLMAANALANAKVNVRFVDKRSAKVTAGQADGISPRTIEVFQSYGIGDRLLKEGCQVHMAAFYNPNSTGGIERTGRAPDVTAPSARYPFELALHQGGIEAIILDSMSALGVEVERSTLPTAIELSTDEAELADPTSHPVRVTLERLDEDGGVVQNEIVRAKFVLGADGAHSWVRKMFDISMDGEQSDFIWGVVDMVPDTDFPDIRNKSLIHSNNGSCLLVPREADRIRIYMQLADKDVLNPNTGRVDKDKMGAAQLLDVAQKSIYPYKLIPTNGINWWTLYIIGQRVASNFSVKDRVFIAGDACHTHSPKAGQGMNASMNDAHNLAWKLAHVVRGWADMSLLSTYESERRKYARDLIAFDKEFSTLFSGKPQTDDNKDGVSHEVFLKAFQTFGGFSSGIGVHYSPSVVVTDAHQSYASNLIIGERVPPHKFVRAADSWPYELQDLLPSDFRFKLLTFVGDVSDAVQRGKVEAMVKELGRPQGFLARYGQERFDIVTVGLGRKEEVDFLQFPALLRPHWSKVLIDDTDVTGSLGGQGYAYYGVGNAGAVVVVRPDGYVGTITPLEGVGELDAYFDAFMKTPV
ncbi:FAD binding domain-containing protein [Hygrophoropsis aurantiaca]|uniref:FAD binding domain-containing protein n=1 Tax=Hygrophoropsis aurantiaca TaxID=72124 RepID=A0ACB8APP7_9AGAM|nr:FAD binding domain-containing protein [Hygrophoropsis aurantiaca]